MKKYTDEEVKKAAHRERVAFRKMIKLYNCFSKYEKIILSEDGNDVYDVLLYKINDKGLMCDKVFVEIKIRYDNFDSEGYVFETKKYNSIVKLAEEKLYLTPDEYKILYINFTPSGTYIWNTDIIKYLEIKTDKMNITTCKSRYEKTNKTNWHLPIDKAIKHFDYVFTEDDIIREDKLNRINNVLNREPEKIDWLSKILFGEEESK